MLKHLVDPLHPTREWPSDLKLKCEFGHATIVELSPHGGYIAVGLADGPLLILDIDTWSVIYRWKQHVMPLLAIKWSKDSRHLVTVGTDWQVCVWDMAAKSLVRSKQLDFSPTAISFDLESPFKFAAVYGTTCSVLELSLDDSIGDKATDLATPPDSDVAVLNSVQYIGSDLLACGTSKGSVHFYFHGEIAASRKLSTGALRAFGYAPSRQILAVACSDRAVRVFYLSDAFTDTGIDPERIEVGHKFSDLGLHSQWNAVTFSQDGEYLYAASDIRHGTVSIWNVLTRFAVRQLRGNLERLTCIKFLQERVLLVGTGRDSGAVFIWRADPPKAWASLISEFEHIPDIEVYQETEDDWDLPKHQATVSNETDVDVWTQLEPNPEIVIPVDLC